MTIATGPRVAIAILVVLVACSREPTAPAPDWTVRVLPVDERIYKVGGEIGFESWNLGFDIHGADSALGADEIVFDYSAAGRPVTSRRMTRYSLQAFIPADAARPSIALRNLHTQLPAALEIDAVRIRAYLRGSVRADRTVPLVRYRQKNRFRLPVSGCWFVSSGHDFGLEHRRWYTRSHFAWDLVRVDENGDPAANANLAGYYSFGQPVLAPADGRVVFAAGDHPDNPPGQVGDRLEANFLLIDHGHGEYCKLAHLAQGSLTVEVGDRVRAGQVVARVGNSGLSDAPHLHVHFQNLVLDGDVVAAEPPLPVELSSYWATSNAGARVWVESGRPRRGEFVCAGPQK